MEIKIVKSAGFCFGVKRAVNLALEAADKYKGENIYTIGHIIHNNDVVNQLKSKNIYPISPEDSKKIEKSVIILRSHGVEKETLEQIKKNKNIIIDAICPFVKKIHDYVDILKKDNYFTVIIGDKGHPEVKAISSFADKDRSLIVTSYQEKDFKEFLKKAPKKIGVVVQTTQDFSNFKKICNKILKIKGEIRIFNSICDATSKRQKESISIAKKVDTMIVIGGLHSANSNRLKELCEKIQKNTFLIENVSQLKLEWLKGKKVVGITAGASTPANIINEVVERIKLKK